MPTPNWMAVPAELGRRRRQQYCNTLRWRAGQQAAAGGCASPAASALAVVVAATAAAATVTATILRFLLNLEAARPFHSEICHHYTTTTTSID